MEITNLSLTNYRGVRSLRLNFDGHLNVFFGVNGAGKSTILDAVAVMLSWGVNRIRHAGTAGRPIQEHDITNGKSFSSIEIGCSYRSKKIEWKLFKTRKGHFTSEDRTQLAHLNEFARNIQGQIASTLEQTDIPLFVYYPVNRAVLDIPLRIRTRHSFSLLGAYDESLTSAANFRTFFEWFREREDLENENLRYLDAENKPDRFLYPDPQLTAVRKALKQFLPEFDNLTVRRDPLRMEVEKNGQRLNVTQLSDGEKCLIALVGDLSRRLAIANPSHTEPLKGEGIVLIDEIDLHLHPRWQRMVISKLLNVFPSCQFIVSTHSPHVLTHVEPENLYELQQTDEGIFAERPHESYGKNIDRILEDLMGLETTRPDVIRDALQELFGTIDRSDIEGSKKQVEELRLKIGSDPDLVKAEALIRRKEITSK
jgi:predicted ATP-binding protein involved in virulence